ncbi:hypothetical protein [Dyadobacter sp. NIV53]|uniref:hypothetical protein n=1 Tax=Dyadobacter sp. NIV53 TaxID=2861765 RepID=UPI001E451F3F|nr:hypothetical protein [Dyadobacter sp. NIV53]
MNTFFTRMKYFIFLKKSLILILFLSVSYACSTATKEDTDSKTADSIALTSPVRKDLNSDQSALLQTILATPESGEATGIIRGITFGDPVSKVKATETFEMFEEKPDHLGYTQDTPQLESIDVLYYIDSEKKVNKITVDVYLNSAEATKQLWSAGIRYFTENYDKPKEEKSVVTWNKKSVRINMEDVSKGKDFGLKFEFFPSGKTILAAK